jgi:hypothetical protein
MTRRAYLPLVETFIAGSPLLVFDICSAAVCIPQRMFACSAAAGLPVRFQYTIFLVGIKGFLLQRG